MRRKINLTNKQTLFLMIVLVGIVALTIGIFIKIQKTEESNLTANMQNYLVTEQFVQNTEDSSEIYEVRYYTGNKKSYLILVERNGTQKEETISEVKTEFSNEYTDFSIDNVLNPTIKNLTQYADDSGFVYTCKTDDIEDFLSNEAVNGRIRFTYAAPSYFECYIENKEGKLMRGLLLYDSDMKTGTLIYKQCDEDISIPTVFDIVSILDSSNKQ